MITTYGTDLLEDAPFECLFAEAQSQSSKDFIMGPIIPSPLDLEDGGQAMVNDLIKVNLRTKEDLQPTFVSARLFPEEQMQYFEFFKKIRMYSHGIILRYQDWIPMW